MESNGEGVSHREVAARVVQDLRGYQMVVVVFCTTKTNLSVRFCFLLVFVFVSDYACLRREKTRTSKRSHGRQEYSTVV